MNRQRLFSILWAIEFIVGLLPAALLIVVGLVPYMVVTPALLYGLLKGEWDAAMVRTAIVLNGEMIGGILGLAAILIAYRPERLRQSSKLKRRAIIFACAGVCAAVLYLTSEGLNDVLSNVFACWIIAGPLLVGAHCLYHVFPRPHCSASSPAA
jgi:peptidoglycan/LPS O-acetylase OafA/YrhL